MAAGSREAGMTFAEVFREETDDGEVGIIEVLNVGAGHLEVRFDKRKAQEVERARRMIKEMLSRGYAIFVEVQGELKPVRRFDADRDAYIIDQIPPPVVQAEGANRAEAVVGTRGGKRCRCGKVMGHRGRCPGKVGREQERAVPVAGHRATAVGRTAGG